MHTYILILVSIYLGDLFFLIKKKTLLKFQCALQREREREREGIINFIWYMNSNKTFRMCVCEASKSMHVF